MRILAVPHYRVKYASDQKQLLEVDDPQLVVTQYQSPQLRLWEMGDGEWLKVVRLPEYTARKRARILVVQGTLPLYVDDVPCSSMNRP